MNRTQKRHISTYMRSRGINGQLQIEVLKYLDNVKQEEIEITKKGQEVISILSSSIQEKLQTDFYGRILQESKVFRGYSQQFLQEVAYIMKEQLYGPSEIIFTLGQYDDRMLFVTKGNVQLYIPQPKNKKTIDLQILEKGEIGHYGFFAEQARSTSLRSLNVSHIAYILREEFLQVLHKFPLDHERFCQMKDLILNQSLKNKIECFACEVSGHSIMNCQRVHYKRDKQTLILKYNYSQDQERNPQQRRDKQKKNTYQLKKSVRDNLLKLRGQKMSQFYQIQFLKDDFEWLEKSKDYTVFQVIPKIYYENGEYIVNSDNDQSQYSEEYDSNNSELQLSDDSYYDPSYQHTPKQLVKNNSSLFQKKLNIQDDLSDLEKQSIKSSQRCNNANNQKSPTLQAQVAGKKENQISNIINTFNLKKTQKQKFIQGKPILPIQNNNNLNKMRRKSAFCLSGISPIQPNNIIFHKTNEPKLQKQNSGSQIIVKSQSEKNIVSPNNISLKDNLDEKASQKYDNLSSAQLKQKIKDLKNQNYTLKEEDSLNESIPFVQNNKSLKQNSKKQQKQELNSDNNELTEDLRPFSSKLNELMIVERRKSSFTKNGNFQELVQNKQQIGFKLISAANDDNKQSNQKLNASENQKHQIKKANEIKEINFEDQELHTDDYLPFKSDMILENNFINSHLEHLDPPSPIIKFEIQQMNQSGNQKNQLFQKNLISFQNMQMSYDVISEEKTNSSLTKNSREMRQSRKNHLDFDTSKNNLSSFAAKAAYCNESLQKQQNQGDENFNNTKNSSRTIGNNILSPITNKATEDQKLINNLNIPIIQSINEIANEDDNEFKLENKDLNNQDKSNKSKIPSEKQAEDLLQNENLQKIEEQNHWKPKLNLDINKPKQNIQFNQEYILQDEMNNQNQPPKQIYSKEERIKMLQSRNSSMKDIFQKKQEIQKSKFANNQYNSNNNYQLDQGQSSTQSPVKYYQGKLQSNYLSVNNNQNTNNLNLSINQAISPMTPLQSPIFPPFALKQIQNQLNQSNHSIASPHNREKKDSNNQVGTQIQLLQQMQSLFLSQLNTIQQQILSNQQKQPSTSQTIFNQESKSPKSNNNVLNLQTDLNQKEETNLQQEDAFFRIEIDTLKSFQIYFPHHNFHNVIKQFNYVRGKKQTDLIRKAKRKLTKDQKKNLTQTPSKFNNKRNSKHTILRKSNALF